MSAPHRARILGTRHMASGGHYLAAQAAFQILEAGGNAVDAGVAGGLVLNVVLSEFVSFGGVAPIMISLAGGGEIVTISGLGWWPKASRLETFHREHGGRIPPGVLRTIVPAAPDAWITALARYGTMRFGEVAATAIRLARDGFPISSLSCEIIASYEKQLRRWPSNAALYLPKDRPPQPGECFALPDLARTMQHMADEERAAGGDRRTGLEAARDAFYRGDIAAAIAKYQREHGGWLSMEDLAEYRSAVEPPVVGRFRDLDVYTCGPWCQGPVLSQALSLLEGIDLHSLGHNSPAYIHVVTEAVKLAFADRHHYYGDPRFVNVPMEALLSRAYAARRQALIRPDRASDGMPPPGSPDDLGVAPATPGAPGSPRQPSAPEALDTSYICVADSHGNLFSATPSDGAESGPVVPGLGFVASTRGSQSWTDPSLPACLAPGKRPRLTPSPTIVARRGSWRMPIGSPGNDVQPQAMLEVLLNSIVFDMRLQEAIEQPRFATFSFPQSSEPHNYAPGRLNLEGRLPAATADALRQLGHNVVPWPDWEWRAGAVCLIRRDKGSGLLEGAADPRRPCAAIGW